jgi:hypothetical protein
MRRIIVPADITLVDMLTGAETQSITFQQWAFGRWMNNQEAAESIVKLCRWMQVINKFKTAAKAGDEFVLEDEDHATLLPFVVKSATAEPPLIAAQLFPFHDAVINAPKID